MQTAQLESLSDQFNRLFLDLSPIEWQISEKTSAHYELARLREEGYPAISLRMETGLNLPNIKPLAVKGGLFSLHAIHVTSGVFSTLGIPRDRIEEFLVNHMKGDQGIHGGKLRRGDDVIIRSRWIAIPEEPYRTTVWGGQLGKPKLKLVSDPGEAWGNNRHQEWVEYTTHLVQASSPEVLLHQHTIVWTSRDGVSVTVE